MSKNPYRISTKQLRENLGIESGDEFYEYLEELVSDSVCPALCTEGCEVEPDGYCEHECPSLLLALNLI